MIVYVIVAILSFIFLTLSKKCSDKKKKNILIFMSFFLLFVISALRVEVGTDYNTYVKWFNFRNFGNLPFNYNDFGFNLLVAIIKLFTTNAQAIFVVTSFFILFFVYSAIIKQQKDYNYSLYLFIVLSFYFSSFNGIRQWMAISVFMFAYQFIVEKKVLKYFICIFIASLFHISALVLLPIYFILNFKFNNKIRIIVLTISFFVLKFVDINGILIELMKKFATMYYYRYIASGTNLNAGTGSFFPILLCCGMFLYYLIFKSYFVKVISEEEYNKKINLSLLLSITSIMNTVNLLFARVSLYFTPLILFLLPDAFIILKPKYRKILQILMLIFSMAFMIINTTIKNSNNPLPYNWIFS